MERLKKFSIKQNDTAPALIVAVEHDSDVPIDLTNATVEFHMRNVDTGEVKVDSAGTVHDVAQQQVRYDWIAGDTATPGTYEMEFEVTFADGTVETFPNDGHDVLEIRSQIA